MKSIHRNITYIIYTLLFALLPAGATAQDSLLRYASTIEGIDADNVAVYIEDLRNASVVLDVNGEIPMVPASVTKLFTAATAFRKLNLNDTYRTEILAEGTIRDSTLNGNIIILASGDPTIESAAFPDKRGVADSIALAIQRAGIRRIDGRILIDVPQWLDSPAPENWTAEDRLWPYGTGHHPINYADNRIAVKLLRDGSHTITPSTPGVKITKSRVNRGSEGVWKNGDYTYNIYQRGRKPVYKELANPRPDSTFVNAIRVSLARLDIPLAGRKIKRSKNSTPVYTHLSPTFYDILRSLIMRSDNQMAEAILRQTWPEKSRLEAAEAELDFWNSLGVNVSDLTIHDGSGLSRSNRITAYALADLLAWMADNDENFFLFADTLPRAGVSGTLRSFLKDTPLQQKFVAKTGSLNGVQCYAGYLLDAMDVPSHVIVIMVNGFKGSRAQLKSAIKSLLIEKLL